jgi:hypothetical protein
MKYLDVAKLARQNAGKRYPGCDDVREQNGLVFPIHRPAFELNFDRDLSVFTVGSCFARNIEDALAPLGVQLPTKQLALPAAEAPAGRPNHILNEYTPACIAQRILRTLNGEPFSEDSIIPFQDAYLDLLLTSHVAVSFERAKERRVEVNQVYSQLASAHVVVLTLGYVETWLDQKTGTYLNRKPPHTREAVKSTRYEFQRHDTATCVDLLGPAIEALVKRSIKVILTVSPVPVGTTFSGDDCFVANEYSKSVLRTAAEALRQIPGVDYFPSYEIVRSGGFTAYGKDRIHVKDEVVRLVTDYMRRSFEAKSSNSESGMQPLPQAI